MKWRWLRLFSRIIFYRTGIFSALGNTVAYLHLYFNCAIWSVQWKNGDHIKITYATPGLCNIWELFLSRVSTIQDGILCPLPPLCRIWKRQGSDLQEFLAPFDLAVLGDQAFSEDCKDFLLSVCLEIDYKMNLSHNISLFPSPWSQETWRHVKIHFMSFSKYFILRGWVVVWVYFVCFLFGDTEIQLIYWIALVLRKGVNLASKGISKASERLAL